MPDRCDPCPGKVKASTCRLLSNDLGRPRPWWPDKCDTTVNGGGDYPLVTSWPVADDRRTGARGGIRTRTPFRTMDFESTASAIPPPGPVGRSLSPPPGGTAMRGGAET